MLRTILSVIAAVEVIAPGPLIDAAERIAARNPEAGVLRPGVQTAARLEGAVLLMSMWRSEGSYAVFKQFLGLVGLLALWRPRAYIDVGTALAYESGGAPEWKPWVYSATRVIGLLYVIFAVKELKNR